jgi:hypothetical protein
MSSRERILASIRGEETDRLPVWLKMANDTWRTSQPDPYRGMDDLDLLRAAGCDPMLFVPGVRARAETPHAETAVTEADGVRTTRVATPDGELVGEERLDPSTRSWHPSKHMAETAEDLRRLRWLYTDTTRHVDDGEAARAKALDRDLTARDAVTVSGVGPGPLMDMVQHLCGPVATVYLMTDEPELFREVLALMQADRTRLLEARLPHEAADTFWLTENTSTTLISPDMFRELSAPYLARDVRLVRDHGLIPVFHMCGKLGALLEMIDAIPAAASEAFTTHPVGDVSLAEGRRRMPSKTLIGGTNATLWLEPAEAIARAVEEDLSRCPDRRRIFLTSAGVLPPPVSFDKAKRVVAALKRL